MSNGEREKITGASEEKKKEKIEKTGTSKKKGKSKEITDKKRLERLEENVGKLMEFFSSKDLPELAGEFLTARKGLAGFRTELIKTTESLSNLREAFELLEQQIREGNIRSFKELDSLMNRITKGITLKYEQSIERQKRLGDQLEKEITSREEIEKLRKEGAAEIAASIAVTELASQKLRDLAEAAEASGLMLGMGGERPPVWGKATTDFIDGWFEEKLKKMVMMKTPFAENWRMSWDLERFLASIPKEERVAYRHYAEWFDRTRIEHTCFLSYDAATSVETLQGIASNLSLSTIEAALQREGVVDELIKFQKDAEEIVKLREEKDKLEEQKEDTKAKAVEEKINNFKILIKRRLEGCEDEIKPSKEKPKFDEEKGLDKIEAGRLFIFLGMAADYDIAELTGGDYFLSRVNHLYNRVRDKAKREGDRWWKRDKLIDWMTREIGEEEKTKRKITGLEVFTHKFSGGLLASVLDKKKGHFEKFGLEWEPKWCGDRLINVVKIRDKDKLTKINFEEIGIARENQLSADVLDSARTGDEVRAALIGHNGYLDLPTWANYLKFTELFKHLRSVADEVGFGGQKPRGGTEKDRLMVLMHKDWLHFFRGPGKGTRFLAELFTLGIFPTFRPEYRFVRRLRAIDPETGREKTLGFTLGDSDGEILKLGRSVDSVDVHGFVDEAVRKGCYSPQYAEGILRDEIKLLKVLPGIAPFRNVQEVLDTIGLGGFIGGIFVFIFAPILEFARRLAKQMERV